MANEFETGRAFMHSPHFADAMQNSDEAKQVAQPPLGNPVTGTLIELPAFDHLGKAPYTKLLDTRRSERKLTQKAITQEQLAFLLWSAQGVQEVRGNKRFATFRPVPCGGARHPFETYIAVQHVEGLEAGLYRYVPLEHVGEKRVAIEHIAGLADYETRIPMAFSGQTWAAKSSISLFFSAVPSRTEWRYAEASHRLMLIDVGHVGQNVMLSAVALGLGSCCIAAYDQASCDEVLGLDGEEEYTVYAVAVGTLG